jgi:hypothetical protein
VETAVLQRLYGALKLGDKYTVERLEVACENAFTYTTTPSYINIKNILTNSFSHSSGGIYHISEIRKYHAPFPVGKGMGKPLHSIKLSFYII